MRILFIGWAVKGKYLTHIIPYFKEFGWDCLILAIDWTNEEIEADYSIKQLPNFESIRKREERIIIKDCIEQFKIPPFDILFLCQGNLHYDCVGIEQPIYYHFHEAIITTFPMNIKNLRCIFYSDAGLYRIGWMLYTPEFVRAQKSFLPFGCDPELCKSNKKNPKTIFCGFKGGVNVYNGDHQTPLMNIVYDKRRHYLFLARKLGCFVEYHSYTSQTTIDHITFLQKCNIGINIPGDYDGSGMINDRMFMIPLCGAVLLQWRFAECDALGFKDRENCLLFNSDESLKVQLEWARKFPEKLNLIRKKGKELILSHHTWKHRAKQIIKIMNSEYINLTMEEERQEWLEWYHRTHDDHGKQILDEPYISKIAYLNDSPKTIKP